MASETEKPVNTTWKKSNLQPILSEYGLQAEQRPKKKYRKKACHVFSLICTLRLRYIKRRE